jgi:Nucleoside-diphosphate-sugar epimerases
MNILVTGAAGFIGSHICDSLIRNNCIIALDDLTLGKEENIKHLYDNKNFKFIKQDASNIEDMNMIFKENHIHAVIHLAANSDIQKSAKNPNIDFDKTFITTYSVLEGMRKNNVKKLIFASTSAVYGEKENVKIHEDIGPLFPISYYGAGKLASEAFISAYTHMNDFTTCIFRFPNVIGERLTHGVIFDFIKKLNDNSNELEILGDGNQEKSYIYVRDLVEAIMFVYNKAEKGINYFNIGSRGTTKVRKIADIICEEMEFKDVEYKFTGGTIGWKGDVSKFEYDTSKINNFGWKAKYTSDEAVRYTVRSVVK